MNREELLRTTKLLIAQETNLACPRLETQVGCTLQESFDGQDKKVGHLSRPHGKAKKERDGDKKGMTKRRNILKNHK